MEHFRMNGTIVIETMRKFNYGPRAIKISQNCIEDLYTWACSMNAEIFSLEVANSWLNTEVPKYLKGQCSTTLARLDDVYKTGHVLASNLHIYKELSAEFASAIQDYMDSVVSSQRYSNWHIINIRHITTQFCAFAQCNGVGDVEGINYETLDAYDVFTRESSKAFNINEGLVVGFLNFMVSTGRLTPGYPLYMHYLESDKCTRLSHLPQDQQEMIRFYSADGYVSSHEFYDTIDPFIERMKAAGYNDKLVVILRYNLTLLYLFLDRENLRYSSFLAFIWLEYFGKQLFGSGALLARRTFEMYEDFHSSGELQPHHRWKHSQNKYDQLPQWCRDKIELFLNAKKKEGKAEKTIGMYRTCCVCFCQFLEEFGCSSFMEVTPAIVKEFNLRDMNHKTPEAKGAYNSRIRRFLGYLELRGEAPPGIQYALPSCAAGGERLVEILSDEEVQIIVDYSEKAVTPLQLRDAAMLMIMLDTGFRAVDVCGIKIDDIDWKQRCIYTPQKKTKTEHIQTFSVKTGNCIFRYLRDGRRKGTGHAELFLKVEAPFGPVSTAACKGAMKRSGLSTSRTHLLRKTFATSLLKGGATIVETAEMLGHSDLSTVHKYTALDSERMRMCPLSLAEVGLPLNGRYHHG